MLNTQPCRNSENSTTHAVIGRSHPELMRVDYSGKPSEPLDVTLPAVNKFVKALYHEIADVFPDDWMHIGGDEGRESDYGVWSSCAIERVDLTSPCSSLSICLRSI
jgi:N-acetyl-beta-hexosaminidase